MLFKQGAFQIDPDISPEEMAARRKRLGEMVPRYGRAYGVGEGLAHLGAGIFEGFANRKLDKVERESRGKATELFERAIGGRAEPGPLTVLGIRPETEAQATADDAMAAVGRPPIDDAMRSGMRETAESLGIDPVDLATAISYETAGTFDPTKAGPTTQWGQHRGLIQFGEPQAQQYGVDWNDPVGSQLGADGAVAKYLRDTGVQPGMGLLDIYSAINAGGVGRYDRSDANNGGAPGTVADKVRDQMAGHRAKAMDMFGGQSGGAEAALANPWLTQGQRRILEQQIADEKQANDPLRQMQLRKTELELAQMQNPAPAAPEIVRGADGYNYYVAPGQAPVRAVPGIEAREGGPLVNVEAPQAAPLVGSIKPGYSLIPDESEPSGYRMVAISGGPEDTTKQDARRQGNIDTASDIVLNAAASARNAANNRLVGGAAGRIASVNPMNENAEVYRQVEVMKAQAKVGNLNAMRAASKTGGALGAVTKEELVMLEAMSGALDPASPNFLRDLAKYERVLLETIHGREAGYQIFEATRADPLASQKGKSAFVNDPSVQAAAREAGTTAEKMWEIFQEGKSGE